MCLLRLPGRIVLGLLSALYPLKITQADIDKLIHDVARETEA